ncbi:LPXTG cell wall anchor domain-containing protein [Streptomyces sp. V2I9]|uniref:LPXTG cell wall anchor domain-containing protein n=1 Tax=Streptomyces sp. V2I9 TaxID=3042304 RepID=UPI0027824B02|nr:LPXTG cell wall anchor domain-containing protein [Streptomyces sp. V2I9]MDQ0988138.1 LPXTG-motif cell wall-anchored protein [Streptomyces sp. V2I9]
MTAFTSRRTLRGAVLAAVAAGAVLVPAAAFADSSPKPVPSAPAAAAPSPDRGKATVPAPKDAAPAVAPRGGVAAGERPITGDDSSTTVLAGSAVGAVLLAGVGTIVLRRRSAAGHNA